MLFSNRPNHIKPKVKPHLCGAVYLLVGGGCTNQAENKQQCTELMQLIHLFKEKWF